MDAHPTPPRNLDSGRFRTMPALYHRRVPVVLFVAIAVVLVAVFGTLAHRMASRRSMEIEGVRARLSSMTQVRQERLVAWLQSCTSDAEMVALFPSVIELLDPSGPGIPEDPRFAGDSSHAGHVGQVLDLVVRTHGYGAILVADRTGATLGSTTDPPSIAPELVHGALRAGVEGSAFFRDLHVDGKRPLLLFSAPVRRIVAPSPGDDGLLGVLLFLVDPVAAVYPMMTNRVLIGATDELVLAHIGEPGLRPMTPVRFHQPDSDDTPFLGGPLPVLDDDASDAFLEARDYRGVDVFASIRPVVGTPWMVIGKIDRVEALEKVSGEWLWLLTTAIVSLLAFAVAFVALSRHYRARHFQALADQETRYRALAENARDIILIVDADSRIVEANRAASKSYGYTIDELQGMRLDALRAPDTLPTASERMRQALSGDISYETEHRRRDGTTFAVEVSARGIRIGQQELVLAIIRDIAERKRLEKQSVIAQRMEALGQLAGGVAHDFNNLLTAIRGYAVLVQESLEPEDRRRSELDEVVKASDRAAALTQQLLAFSRRQATERRVVDLNGIVKGLEGMLSRLIGENIRFRTDLDGRALWIRADASQIENLLVNLVVNARDAMSQGGTLTLSTRGAMLSVAGHRAREYACLEVRDTGIGMDDETRARAFEPFFTTKEQGRGTGLGLATCYGIVQQHEGFITLESAPGQGTTVRIDLPMAARTLTDEMPVLTEGPVPRGDESILLAEDDEGVRAYTAQVLRSLGYNVVAAASGSEALEMVRARAGMPIDLLVTDVVMPGMSGVQLQGCLRELRPDLKTLFVSGYAESSMFEMGGVERGASVLRKPFSPAEMGRKIREVLDRKPRRSPRADTPVR